MYCYTFVYVSHDNIRIMRKCRKSFFHCKKSCLQVFLHLLGDTAGGHLSVQGVCSHHIFKARRFRLIIEAKNRKVPIVTLT